MKMNGKKVKIPDGPIVVAKVGSNSITTTLEDGTQSVDPSKVANIAKGIFLARQKDYQVILVTSGAVAGGMFQQHFTKRPGIGQATRLSSLAAIGQSKLMSMYEQEFSKLGISVAQGLPTQSDFHREVVNQHMSETFEDLLSLGVVPIINENDFTSYAEMRFGDNDIIAALVGVLCKAKHLVLFTIQDGIMSTNPDVDPDAHLLKVIDDLTPDMFDDSQEMSAAGSGGINSKLFAGDLARYSGIETAITHVDKSEDLLDVIEGRIECSRFSVRKSEPMSIYFACDVVAEQTTQRENPFFSVSDYIEKIKSLDTKSGAQSRIH